MSVALWVVAALAGWLVLATVLALIVGPLLARAADSSPRSDA